MAKSEPVYEPRDHDTGVFDDGEDEFEEEDDGSRLPLLVVIGVLVLASFIGVVWLAYEHGVQRGLHDAPRVVASEAAPANAQSYDKIYQKPAPADEDEANDDTAPTTPTPDMKAVPAPAAPVATPQKSTLAEKPAASHVVAPPAAKVVAPPPKTASVPAKPATPPATKSLEPQRVATKPPASLVAPATVPVQTKTAAVKPAPVAAAPAAVSASGGDYVLQIGSYKSKDEADASWNAFKARHAMVAGYAENVQTADLGAKGTWYRLRVGSFPSKDAADAFCAKLKADGGVCLLAKK